MKAPSGREATAMSCPACGKPTRRWGEKGGIGLEECAWCGTVRAHASAAAATIYDEAYARPEPTPPVSMSALREIARRAAPFRQTGRWLDVGFGQGAMLEAAAAEGWSCYGTELSVAALDHGRERGWTVATAADDGSAFPPGGFDVVTLIETLEHVSDPAAILAEARRLIRSGGLLYLTTPNIRSLNRRVLGVAWTVVCPPEHLTLLSRRGLRHALERAGFVVERVRAEGLNPAEVLARQRRRGEGAVGMHRQASAVTLNTALTASPPRRAVKRAINGVLSWAGIGDTLKAWATTDRR